MVKSFISTPFHGRFSLLNRRLIEAMEGGAQMHQLFSLVITDWLMPNPEKDTPFRWAVRLVLLVSVGIVVTSFG
jgi:hypothetical protein